MLCLRRPSKCAGRRNEVVVFCPNGDAIRFFVRGAGRQIKVSIAAPQEYEIVRGELLELEEQAVSDFGAT